MQNFNFSRLVNKYGSEFTVIIPAKSELNDSGDFVKGEPEKKTLFGAIIGRGEKSVFRSEGKLTEKDKRLFMLEEIDKSLLGTKVVYENEVFSILSSTENAKFTGVWAYTLKYVSAFKEGEDE